MSIRLLPKKNFKFGFLPSFLTTLVFDVFTVSFFRLQYSSKATKMRVIPSDVSAKMTISSAKASNISFSTSLNEIPFTPLSLRNNSKSLIKSANKNGLRVSPCRTPSVISIPTEMPLPGLAAELDFLCSFLFLFGKCFIFLLLGTVNIRKFKVYKF